MDKKIIKVYGLVQTQVGEYVAEAKQIGLSQGGSVEDELSGLIVQIESLRDHTTSSMTQMRADMLTKDTQLQANIDQGLQALENSHKVMSESEFNLLPEKNPEIIYLTYEDE